MKPFLSSLRQALKQLFASPIEHPRQRILLLVGSLAFIFMLTLALTAAQYAVMVVLALIPNRLLATEALRVFVLSIFALAVYPLSRIAKWSGSSGDEQQKHQFLMRSEE